MTGSLNNRLILALRMDLLRDLCFRMTPSMEEQGKGPAIEVLHLSNGQVIWSVIDSLRAAADEEDSKPLFQRSMASSHGNNVSDDMEVHFKEHRLWIWRVIAICRDHNLPGDDSWVRVVIDLRQRFESLHIYPSDLSLIGWKRRASTAPPTAAHSYDEDLENTPTKLIFSQTGNAYQRWWR